MPVRRDDAIAPHGSRTHPPSLLRLTERLLRDERLLSRGDAVLCACSGGPDSTALLHVLSLLRKRLGFEVFAHGVDHGLRAEAPHELELSERVARAAGIPFQTTRIELQAGPNLQARARTARLSALASAAMAKGARAIATGHTADDRAETVLLRLLRGAGPRGLAVLPPSAPLPIETAPPPLRLIRPLLRARRVDVLAHLHRHELAFARDPSNENLHFARVRVRRELLPLLETLSPGIVVHLCALADMLATEGNRTGLETELGRAQILALERARRLGRSGLQLRLQGGRDVEVTFQNHGLVSTKEGKS